MSRGRGSMCSEGEMGGGCREGRREEGEEGRRKGEEGLLWRGRDRGTGREGGREERRGGRGIAGGRGRIVEGVAEALRIF
uniref:Uncharacterized protein n=1 Tax=Oryza sativa subsp. japonica TaxID=39947 RepID=Q60DC0_ORYSJ|nr:hypothetical protein [Oryza sativa Japonica Group]